MNNLNRTEEKKLKRAQRRERKKYFSIIMLCIIFFVSMIYATDISTSKMMQKSDNKYAIYAKYEKNGIVRIDIAGETIRLSVEPLADLLRNLYEHCISLIHANTAFYSNMLFLWLSYIKKCIQ